MVIITETIKLSLICATTTHLKICYWCIASMGILPLNELQWPKKDDNMPDQ